jgi:hypothetical protein
MPHVPLKISAKTVHIHKSIVSPDFGKPTVLVENQWDYVTMWLRRHQAKKALFYWDQASHFHYATQQLPKTSSPLTSYYCALNAVKALLISKAVTHSDQHGLHGDYSADKVHLQNEYVIFERSGVFPALCQYLGEPIMHDGEERYSLKDIIYNLPFVHRAYTLTFTSQPELFIPISQPTFVRKAASAEAWFQCTIRDRRYQTEKIVGLLPGFERDVGIKDDYVIRRTKRFEWRRGDKLADNIDRLTRYHQGIRKRVFYIRGTSRLWYLKRGIEPRGYIRRSCTTLTFAALHRLSELARYTPDRLARHFDAHHNWLLSEFLERALDQLVDQLSSEITGSDFMPPGYSG